ncbi:hypothetical protein P7C71_g2040, partial [Lecanoromycetidae sp. Uapishka_2]
MAHIEFPDTQPAAPLGSQMTQEDHEHGNHNPGTLAVEEEQAQDTTKKRRPWSSQDFKSILSPSPTLIDSRRSSKDDLSVTCGPVTPKRPATAPRGLSLQMPPRDLSSTSTANLSKRIPPSPKPESSAPYPSPASVLPRRSRGLDFSRAATNLHHSTLAESSPESSPIVGSRGDPEESEDGGDLRRMRSHEDVPIPAPVTPSMEDRRSVIRRAVTRRTNMLPKPKGFARIRAALLEEGAPVDTETKREAEVVRQVRESDADGEMNLHPSQPTTTASSPSLIAATAGSLDRLDSLEHLPEDDSMNSEDSIKPRPSATFTTQAMRNATGGPAFWNNFDERMRTPPPQLMPRESSSGMSDDLSMDTPSSSLPSTVANLNSSRHIQSQETSTQITTFDIPRKGNKRMRDDDFDPNYFKRRAVSPGLSLQNSPVLPQSPLQRDNGSWGLGTSKSNREVPSVHVSGERAASNGSNGSMSAPGGTPKRIGLQGITDTHDGMMNMSIE